MGVKRILYAHEVDMGGIRLRQPLPTQRIDQIDPFLLLHHLKTEVKPGSSYKHSGVGPHPHRGFSPVTFVFHGAIHHRDSRGNDDVVEFGGAQWMNAGMGIVHSERPSKQLAQSGGIQEIIQLWINTPSTDKMAQPYYLPIKKGAMPHMPPDVGQGEINLVSGTLNEMNGPAISPVPVLSAMIDMSVNSMHAFQMPKDHDAKLLYVLSGTVRVVGHGQVEELNLIQFDEDTELIEVEAVSPAQLLLLSGRSIGEPVSQHGPFVMNNQTQIMEAMRDYQMGKMGILIEDFD